MDETEIRNVLLELERCGATHDAQETDHARKLLNLEPETAHLIYILVRSSGRKRLLEIGTSNGYSTIWLAWAAEATGGQVTSLDRNAEKHRLADANLRRVGLRERVELLTGDATEIIRQLLGPFDLVFFDADRLSAPAQLELLLPKLTPEALLLADNALSHPEQIAGYLAAVRAHPALDGLVIPIGKGLSLAYWNSPGR
jgi:predicted O-methyltransferase YrrM